MPDAGWVQGLTRNFGADGGIDPTPMLGPASGSFLMRRELFEAVGGMREDLLAGETADLLDRARTGGHPGVLVDDVVLERRVHAGNTTITRTGEVHAAYLALARERILARRPRNPGP